MFERPIAPFEGWPVDVEVPGLGFCWYLRAAAAFVSQSYVSNGTLEMGDLVNDLVDDVLARDFPHVKSLGGLFILHDWRSIRAIDPAAGPPFMARLKRRPRGYLRKSYVVVDLQNKMLETAVVTTSAFAAMTLGTKIEVVTDAHAVVQRHTLRPSLRPGELRSLRPVG